MARASGQSVRLREAKMDFVSYGDELFLPIGGVQPDNHPVLYESPIRIRGALRG